MAITLPNASTANTDSTATINAEITAAQTAFIAEITVLINSAIANGLFQVQPYLPPLVTSTYVNTYFSALGYTVNYPINPSGCGCNSQYNPCFVDGFPEVLPPGYVPWNCECNSHGPARIGISWPPNFTFPPSPPIP